MASKVPVPTPSDSIDVEIIYKDCSFRWPLVLSKYVPPLHGTLMMMSVQSLEYVASETGNKWPSHGK